MAALSDPVRRFLDEPRFGVLATTNADGTPQQTVMWYLRDGDHIVMNTARGRRKDRNLLRDCRASLCIEDGQRYLTLAGEIELDDDPATAQADIRRLAVRYEGEEAAARMVASDFSRQERVTLRFRVTGIDARGLEDQA